MKDTTALIENIERILRERKMNKKTYAEKIGVHRTTVSDWMRGVSYMNSDNIVRTADLFGVSVGELFGEHIPDNAIITLLENQQKQIDDMMSFIKNLLEKNVQ